MRRPKRQRLKSFSALLIAAAIAAGVVANAETIETFADRPDLPAASVRSGSEFLSPETRALQQDAFANPGYLWVDRGETLFREDCAGCHTVAGMKGVAAGYPRFSEAEQTLLDLSAQINVCRTRRDEKQALAHESDDMLALNAFVSFQSRGQPFNVDIDGPARPYFDQGRSDFFERQGQLNLACHQCHDSNWGKMLRGDRISQGHPTAWPAYRLEWQGFGSLHRRLQDCDAGVRAEQSAAGSIRYRSLELYLNWRARDLPMETPGVRR